MIWPRLNTTRQLLTCWLTTLTCPRPAALWAAVCHHLINAPSDDARHVTQMLENVYVDMYKNDDTADEWCGIIRPIAPALDSVAMGMGSACKAAQR